MDVKEKLVELLQHDDCPLFMVFGDKVDVLADYLISNGVTVQEWISVKDRLPNVNTDKSGYESKGVIVRIDGCNERTAYRFYERACKREKIVYRWKYPWDRISDENITHWMEMPQPPKGE